MIRNSLIYKYRYDLALYDGPGSRLLMWVTGMMVFLATLAFAFNLSLSSLNEYWSSGISGVLTVEIPASVSESSTGTQKILSLLRRHPDIASADLMSQEQVRKLVEPWLGSAKIADALPLPQLIDVRLKMGKSVNVRALGEQLNLTLPGVSVTDHMDWLKSAVSLGRALRLAALFLALVMAALAIVTIAGIIHARYEVNRRDVELLHLMGASDDYIARQFQNHALASTLKGAGIGTLAAAVVAFLSGLFVSRLNITIMTQNSLETGDLMTVILLPLIAGCVIAAVTARVTLMRELLRLP